MSTDAATSAASAGSALILPREGGGASAGAPRHMGPGLAPGMNDAEVFERLNAWGIARDGDLQDLAGNLARTQDVVSATFEQARATLVGIVEAFRTEAEVMRQNSYTEAAQGLARLEQVVIEARGRFEAQEAGFTRNLDAQAMGFTRHLDELTRRQQRVETFVQAAPTQTATQPPTLPRSVVSPGGTLHSFYPGGPADGVPAAASGFSTPPRDPPQLDALQQPPRGTGLGPMSGLGLDPAWGPWAAGRGASPQGQPPQRQPPQFDAWAGAAAARHQTPQPGGQARHSIFTPGDGGARNHWEANPFMSAAVNAGGGGDGGRPREMRLDARGWAVSQPKLDVGMPVDSFQIWKDRALMFLSRERPDVRKLLCWAETQSKEALRDGLAAQAAHLGITDLAGVEYALHDGIKMTIMDTLLGRARCCIEQGCELWRALCAEWSGAAPQLQHAKARRYQDPPTCKTVAELWSKLPAWERLGEEVALSGLALPEWMAMSSLEQLLPAGLRDTLVARASCGNELTTFATRLAWVKVQMEHARGLAQATEYAPRGKDASGDVNMYSVDAPPGFDTLEGMTWALAEAAHAGDYAMVDSLQHSIYAMKGGGKSGFRKGGLGKGKSGKNGPSGAAPGKGEGGGAEQFQGACNHCGIWGHRRSECRKLTAELGKAGPKGKAGGKGGPAGGKGPAAPIAELGAADGWAGDLLDDAVAGAAAEFEDWNFGAAMCSVTAETECCMGPWSCASRRRRGPRPSAARTSGLAPVGSAQHNRFAALSLLTDGAEELLAAVSSGARGGRVIEAIVDSGAVHSVTPPGLFPGRTVPSPWSLAGRGYRAANGSAIANLGQVAVKFCTAEGDRCAIPFQVAAVDQPLLSVAHLAAAGNRVELSSTSGRVVNEATGRSIALERRGGVYIMRMYVADGAAPAPAPFPRQA